MATRIIRAHRFRLEMTRSEAAEVRRFSDARRRTWNWGLAMVKDTLGLEAADDELAKLSEHGPVRLLDRYALINLFKVAKIALPWSDGIPVRVFEYAFEDLTAALSAFFSGRKAGRKVGFPRFIGSDDPRSGFTVRGAIHLEKGRIKLPLIDKPLRVRGSTRRLEREIAAYAGKIKEATVRRDGRYWTLALVIERAVRVELDENAVRSAQPAGLDLGLHTLATLSDGVTIANPRLLDQRRLRLRALTRGVARSEAARAASALLPAIERHGALLETWAAEPPEKRGQKPIFPRLVLPSKSHRHQKKATHLARAQHRVAEARRTLHGQAAAAIVPSHLVLGIEDLATANLLQNHCLARAISDAGWASLVSAMETRAEDRGSLIIKAGRFFASSQICANCGHPNPAVKDLALRIWTCPVCRVTNYRDENAAQNLVPSPGQIASALTERTERQAGYQRRREQIAVRAKQAGATNHRRQAERQIRAAQRAASSITINEPSPREAEDLRRPDARATLNRAWRTGQSEALAPARSATRRSRRPRPETRTDVRRSVRISSSRGSP